MSAKTTSLVLRDGETVQLPAPAHKAAIELSSRLPTMINALSYSTETRPFLYDAMVAANSLPSNTSPLSLLKSVANAAQLGLRIGGSLGHAYIVPFRRHKGTPKEFTEAVLVIGYRGYLHLAYACDFLAGITTECVLKGENAKRWMSSTGPQIEHELAWDRDCSDTTPGILQKIEAVYCQYTTRAGYHDLVVVAGREVRSLAKKQGNVWDSNPVSMSYKTAIRRASKRWQSTERLTRAVQLDEQADRNEPQTSTLEQLRASIPGLQIGVLDDTHGDAWEGTQ